MRSTVISGLVRIAGDVSPAANEDRIAQGMDPGVSAEEHRRTDAPAGWDPYDVWRTRVKKARDPKKPDSKK